MNEMTPPVRAGDRRKRVLEILSRAGRPVKGAELSRLLGVSRQVIVQDIALLRAQGQQVLATPHGYCTLEGARGVCRDVIPVCHPPERTPEELYTLVDHGLKVLDVIVKHPLYGELHGTLMLQCREDVNRFLDEVQARKASLLSALTGGFHLHTVEAARWEQIEQARKQLEAKGLLAR